MQSAALPVYPGEIFSGREHVDALSTSLAVFGGFMDVRGDRVVVLTDAAEHADEIDANRAQEARDRAQQVLAAGTASAADEQRARAELQRSLVRLRVSESRRRRR